MNRIKMAVGMLLGAVLLQLGFMACSAQNTSGMMAKFFDGGAQGGDTGVMGGRDARAQEMPCTQWQVGQYRETREPVPGQPGTYTVGFRIEAGWEPFASGGVGETYVLARRCTAR